MTNKTKDTLILCGFISVIATIIGILVYAGYKESKIDRQQQTKDYIQLCHSVCHKQGATTFSTRTDGRFCTCIFDERER